jgi:hypothetical protein
VRIAGPFSGTQQDPAFVDLLNDRSISASVCGDEGISPGTFSQEGRQYGGFAGAVFGAVFVDGTIRRANRDFEYGRGTCTIEYDPSRSPSFASGVVNDANGDAIVDAGEFQTATGRGVLYYDGNGNGALNVGESLIDDIYAGTVSATTETGEVAFSVRAGADAERSNVIFGPRAIFTYTLTEVDGYTETGRSTFANPVRSNGGATVFRTLGGPIGLELAYEEQLRRSLLLELGGEAGYRIGIPDGSVVPFFAGYWRHEFEDELQVITAQMAQDRRPQPTRFTYAIDGADPDSALVAFGANTLLFGRMSLRGEVSRLMADEFFDATVFSLQARIGF